MARGFESKDIEYQQAEAERNRRPLAPVAPADREREAGRRTVELALASARAEQASTSSPVRREILTRAIADLESQLSQLTSPSR